MKKLIALPVTIAFLLAPLMASAATVQDLETKIKYLLGQVAALQAGSTGVACAAVTSKSSITAGETFELIWNSYGSKAPSASDTTSQYEQSGVQTIRFTTPGTFHFKFPVTGVNGSQAFCETSLVIRA